MTTALEGGEGSASRPGRFLPPGKDSVSIVLEAGWAPGPVWTGAENLVPHRDSIYIFVTKKKQFYVWPKHAAQSRTYIKVPQTKSRKQS